MADYKTVAEYKKFIESKAKWDIWLTSTFRQPRSAESAFKTFKYFFKKLNNSERQFFSKYILCFVVLEPHEDKTRYHVHALISGISPLLADELQAVCRDFFGHRDVVQEYKPSLPRVASNYLAKKCARGEEWKIIRINSKWRGGGKPR